MLKNLSIIFFIMCSVYFTTNIPLTSALSASPLQEQEEIPLLDLMDYKSNDREKQKNFVEQMGNALHTSGFVLIKNHQILQKNIDAVHQSAHAFFTLPLDIKKHYQGIHLNRGYKSFNPNRPDKKADMQEYWHVGPLFNFKSFEHLEIPEIQKNVWPIEVPSFESDFSVLYEEIAQKSQPILEACSLYMGKESSFLSDLTQYGDSVMRVIHYLPSNNQEGDKTWKGAHQDPNLLTVIVGVSMEGLELQGRDGRWIPVPYIPDAIVVSASNMLESLSNGLIRSAPHRVAISQANTSRFSIPFFFHVQRNLMISPQEISIAMTGGKPLYPQQTAEDSLKGHHWFSK